MVQQHIGEKAIAATTCNNFVEFVVGLEKYIGVELVIGHVEQDLHPRSQARETGRVDGKPRLQQCGRLHFHTEAVTFHDGIVVIK